MPKIRHIALETQDRGPDGVVFDLSDHPSVGAARADRAGVPIAETAKVDEMVARE